MRPIFMGLAAVVLLGACSQREDPAADETDSANASIEPASPSSATPAPAAARTPDPALSAGIRANYADMGEVLYKAGEVDLDGDGAPEILAYIGGPMMCGTGGCNLVVLQRTGQGLDKLGELSVTQLPVGVFETSTNGWRDLAVSISGGGIRGGVARVPFGKDQYAGNATVPPAAMTDEPLHTVIPLGKLDPLG